MTTRTAMNWEVVRNRLAAQQAALEQAAEHFAAEVQATHRRRAQELAARGVAAVVEDTAWPGLIFLIGRERFCLPLSSLVEVLPCTRCTPTPGGPPELSGVVHIRGEVRSVLDLAQILELPAVAERPPGYIVLVRHGGAEIGLLVDELEKIERISSEKLTSIDGELTTGNRPARARTPSRATVLQVEEILARCNF